MRTLSWLACATALAPAAAAIGQTIAQSVPGSPTDLLVGPRRDALPKPQADAQLPKNVVTVPDAVASAGVIKGVVFDGVDPPVSVADAARPFLDKPITLESVQGLARALSDAYGETSIALFTVNVPAQTFADGVIHVQIIEGFIEHTTIVGETDARSLSLVKRYAAEMTGKRPLSKRVLQRYLSLIRDIPGLTVETKLLRGSAPGGVQLYLGLNQKGHEVSFSYNNLTQRSLANGEFGATGKLYGALRPGDQTSLQLASATDFKAFRYVGLSHSTPIVDGAQLSAAFGHIETRQQPFDIRGNANVASIGVSYPLIRGYQRNASVSAVLDGVNSDNAVLGSLLVRERTRAARITATYAESGERHAVSASLIGAKGIDILGAETALTGNDLNFSKLVASAAASRAFGKAIAVRAQASGQLSRSALPAVERFLVGGDHFGRAYPVATLAADQGSAVSAEVAWLPFRKGSFARSELYVFGDRAAVRYNQRGLIPVQSFDLASAGFGVKAQFRDKATLRAELARRVKKPFPSNDSWQVNLAWRLSLGR